MYILDIYIYMYTICLDSPALLEPQEEVASPRGPAPRPAPRANGFSSAVIAKAGLLLSNLNLVTMIQKP